jgi:hypothetical protein
MSSITWAQDRFYWAVLAAPGVRAGVLPSGLGAALQDEVPVNVESLHAAAVPIDGGSVLVCAARREELASLPPNCLSLLSEGVPDRTALLHDVPPPEMLVGAFEPHLLRRERARRWWCFAAAIALSAGLVSVGLVRRADQLTRLSGDTRQQASSVLLAATGSADPALLQREIARVQDLAAVKQPYAPTDGATTLAALLRAWPDGVECEISAVSVGPSAVSMTVSVTGDSRTILDAIKPPRGWTLEEPRLSTTGQRTRVVLRFKRRAGGDA